MAGLDTRHGLRLRFNDFRTVFGAKRLSLDGFPLIFGHLVGIALVGIADQARVALFDFAIVRDVDSRGADQEERDRWREITAIAAPQNINRPLQLGDENYRRIPSYIWALRKRFAASTDLSSLDHAHAGEWLLIGVDE